MHYENKIIGMSVYKLENNPLILPLRRIYFYLSNDVELRLPHIWIILIKNG